MADTHMFDWTLSFPSHAIAIVGLAGRFPDAQTLDDFWRNVWTGTESLQTFSDVDLDGAGVDASLRSNPLFVRKGTILAGAELFDAGFFGLSPREAQILDPQHRVFLECAWEAMEHAGYAPGTVQKSVGVYAGASMNTYVFAKILQNKALIDAVGGYQIMLGNDKDFLCTRVSYKLDLHGPSMTIQTACSTSLVAVEVACRALQSGECDMALAGGVSLNFPERSGYLYTDGMILSPDGHCRPFDLVAAGTRAGAGAGIVVLKRLTDALADRDTIHAVIIGASVNNDGAGKVGYTAPSIDGQVEAIATAQALAGVDPRSISYIEAHGTATPLGDPIEIAALTQVFRASTPDIGFCRIGSLKSNLGHLDAAAGIAGLIKTVLALEHRQIPPLVNFRSPNPQLDLEHSPFVASAEGTAWPSGAAPRRAGVSSFGIGGTNAHVVLQEAPPIAQEISKHDNQLLVLSARTATGLDQATENLAAYLEGHSTVSLRDVAWTLQVGRKPFAHRRAMAVPDVAQAAALLRQPRHTSVFSAVHEGGTRQVAFLFSGQGSQHVGMGAELYRTEPHYRDAIDHCATLLQPHLGLDIRNVMFGDANDLIHETRLTQPALFCTEYALATLWTQWGVTPATMLGHSIGEYVAAHLSGVFSLNNALAIVATRGRLMQAIPPGAMAAVHHSASGLSAWLDGGVEIAAENAPGLCTISGPPEAMGGALRRLESRGIMCRPLHTSHAFHSAMMEPALTPFIAALEGISLSPPAIPYVSNVTGTWITAEQATSPSYYAEQLRRPVRFEAGIRTLANGAATFFLEIGPTDALISLTRATLGADRMCFAASSLSNPRRADNDRRAMLEAAGRLWLSGISIEWPALHEGGAPRRVPLPTYPFERVPYSADAPEPPRSVVAEDRVREPTVGEQLYAPSWARDETLAVTSPRLQGLWLVLGDHGSLTGAVTEGLLAAGAVPVRVEAGAEYEQIEAMRFRVRPGEVGDIEAVLGATRCQYGQAAGAIVLWDAAAHDRRFGGSPTPGYAGLVALAAGLDTWDDGAPMRIIAASIGAQSVLDEPIARPEAALLFGPVMVLPTEMPGLAIRSVDLEDRGAVMDVGAAAAALLAEATSDDADLFAAWRRGRRWLRRFQPITAPAAEAASLPIKHAGVYLITGGLGGVGLALAEWVADRAAVRLLLTARRALPPREAWDALLARPDADARSVRIIQSVRKIEALGGEVIVAAADAADRNAMANAIEQARLRWGGVDGVIHAAGIAGDGRIAVRQDAEEIRSIIAPKVGGLTVLVQLLGETKLDFVALMSSISSVIGSPGTASYAAANAVLDAFVESGRRPAAWRRVFAVNWAAWREVGMAADLVVPEAFRAEREAFLRTAIATKAGVEAFERILVSGRQRVIVTSDALDHPMKQPRAPAVHPATVQVPATSQRHDQADAIDAPRTDTERSLAGIWSELIGVATIGVDDDFFQLGGHSLLATRVLARISALLGVRLALRDVFLAPTIRLLAERISAVALQNTETVGQSTDDREEILI
jgi:phthiocerol/phenolphthiocerol synthesis type-I polyketide synthase E